MNRNWGPAAMMRNPLAHTIRLALLSWLVLLVAGCAGNRRDDPPVIPQVVEVAVVKYVPVPDDLAADCRDTAPKEQTYAEAKRLALLRTEFLAECSERMRKIRALGRGQ